MNEFEKKVTGLLNSSLDQLNENQVTRLRLARERALPRREASTVLATSNGHSLLFGRRWAPTIMLLAGLIAFAAWYALPNFNDPSIDDTDLLEDELPIHAYLDHNFDSWLNRSSP